MMNKDECEEQPAAGQSNIGLEEDVGNPNRIQQVLCV